jgi:hypothetical protein
MIRRFWFWYRRVTGYDRHVLQYRTGLKIQSTFYPEENR